MYYLQRLLRIRETDPIFIFGSSCYYFACSSTFYSRRPYLGDLQSCFIRHTVYHIKRQKQSKCKLYIHRSLQSLECRQGESLFLLSTVCT